MTKGTFGTEACALSGQNKNSSLVRQSCYLFFYSPDLSISLILGQSWIDSYLVSRDRK